MINTMSVNDFTNWFADSESRKDQFSYNGLVALFEWLQELEGDMGENIEFDPIALCCEYTEYENLKELQGEYNDIESMDDLRDNTTVIEIEGSEGFIIQAY